MVTYTALVEAEDVLIAAPDRHAQLPVSDAGIEVGTRCVHFEILAVAGADSFGLARRLPIVLATAFGHPPE